MPQLATRLAMRQHAALATRIVSPNVLGPRDRQGFTDLIEHGLSVAGATSKVLSPQAHEVLWRTSHGIPRMAARLLRTAMALAHARDQSFVDDETMLEACDDLRLTRPTDPAPRADPVPAKPRRNPGTTSRV